MKIEIVKKNGFAISIIAFPAMLLAGFIMHPNLLKLEALQTVEQLVGRFHNQPIFHIGHLGIIVDKAGLLWVFCSAKDTKKYGNFKCLQPCG